MSSLSGLPTKVSKSHESAKALNAYGQIRLIESFTAKRDAENELEKLLKALAGVGLTIEVRNGESQSLLILVRAPAGKRFYNTVYRSR